MADEARELSRKWHDWRLQVAAGNRQAATVVKKLIASNPAEGCALPKAEHTEMKTLTAEQLSSFLREAKDSNVFEMYYVELATGLRRGELLGLKWGRLRALPVADEASKKEWQPRRWRS